MGTEVVDEFKINGREFLVLWKVTACYLRCDGRFWGDSLGEDLSREECIRRARFRAADMILEEREKEAAVLYKLYEYPMEPAVQQILKRDYLCLQVEVEGDSFPVVYAHYNGNVYVCYNDGWVFIGVVQSEQQVEERVKDHLAQVSNPKVGNPLQGHLPNTPYGWLQKSKKWFQSQELEKSREAIKAGLALNQGKDDAVTLALCYLDFRIAERQLTTAPSLYWQSLNVLLALALRLENGEVVENILSSLVNQLDSMETLGEREDWLIRVGEVFVPFPDWASSLSQKASNEGLIRARRRLKI